MKGKLVSALVIVLVGCATMTAPKPETAEEGWNHAKRQDTLYAYRAFVNNHPNSTYDAQARLKLREAQASRKKVLVNNAQIAKQTQSEGKRVWDVTNDAGEKIVLYQGMTVDQTEQALGFPLILIPKGSEQLKIDYTCPVTGIRLMFAMGGILRDIGQGEKRFNERDLLSLTIDPSYFPRSLSVQQR